MPDPRVELVHGEGRHFLARTDERYDVIQLSGVDSASGTPAAAHVFSENYIYSAEAFDLYLSRLTPDGIVNMMRQEYLPPREMLRALVTAVAALRRAGVQRPARPRRHGHGPRTGSSPRSWSRRRRSPTEEERTVSAWADGEPLLRRLGLARR